MGKWQVCPPSTPVGDKRAKEEKASTLCLEEAGLAQARANCREPEPKKPGRRHRQR